MIGLILSLLWSAYAYFIGGTPFTEVYTGATNFLFWWYIAWAVVMGLFVIVMWALVSLGLGAKGNEEFGFIGGLLGLTAGGGCIGVVLLVAFVINEGALILGSWLLRTAMVDGQFDPVRVAFGIGLVLVGILVGAGRSSASASSRSKK